MEQARKRLVELLSEADYVTSEDSNYPWWDEDVTVGCISKNYSKYKYLYSLNENHYGNAVFFIDNYSIWSILEKKNNMSWEQVKDLTKSTLGDHYNFGDIATSSLNISYIDKLEEHYNS